MGEGGVNWLGLVQGLINWRPQQVSGTGKVVVKQSDFGIEPVSAAGGLVQVEDDVTVTFRIVAEREERELPQIRIGLFRSFHSSARTPRLRSIGAGETAYAF
jgi:hypothetical protein